MCCADRIVQEEKNEQVQRMKKQTNKQPHEVNKLT